MNLGEIIANWYKEFPRQVLIYRKWVDTYESFIKEVERLNGKDDIYVSVFFYPEKDLDKPVIDRIVFDFDYGKKGEIDFSNREYLRFILDEVLKEVRSFCSFLESLNLIPHVVFSGGRGFHVYVFFDRELKVTREDLLKFVEYVKKELNLKFIDPKITYDFARLIRVPYTRHMMSGLFCIPVKPDWSINKILQLAENPIPIPLVRIPSSAVGFMAELEKIRLKEAEKKLEVAPAVKFDGKYMSLPCINELFSYKLPAGKRRMKASKFIAIAYYLDHGTMEGFEEVAKIFAKAQDIDHKLRIREVLGWKRGIYRLQQPPQWNCAEVRKYLLECKIPLPCLKCEYKRALIEAKKMEKKNEFLELIKKLEEIDLLVEVKRILDAKIVGEDKLKVLLYLLLLSKQNIVLKGEFASGKNTIADAVVDLFPEESRLTISAYTQKILRWLQRDSIPILYLKELPPEVLSKAGQLKDFTFDLKLVMSDKILEIYYVDRGEDGFETKSRKLRVESVLQTTPALDMPEDYKSRVWILSTDPSEEQTMKVLLKKAQDRKTLKHNSPTLNVEDVRKLSDLLMRLNIRTIIPFSETIAKSVKLKSTKMRREIDKLFDLIAAVTKTRLPKRLWKLEDEDQFVLVSEIEDFIYSRTLFQEYMELSVMDMERRFTIAIDTFNKIVRERGQVTLLDFARELGTTKKKAKEILDILNDRGLIEEIEDEEDVYTSSVSEVSLEIFNEIKLQDLEEERRSWMETYKDILKPGRLDEFLNRLDEYISLE
jgi:DNA-binding MarR family transcriptional regulator